MTNIPAIARPGGFIDYPTMFNCVIKRSLCVIRSSLEVPLFEIKPCHIVEDGRRISFVLKRIYRFGKFIKGWAGALI
jgi:hypothetical protein